MVGDIDPAGATALSPAEPTPAPAREAPPLVAGTQIDKYRLVRVIGSGGMGVVWAARDPDLDREVALKVLRAVDAGQTLRTRLLREARAMARLKHPNVLTVYEVGTEYDRDYIAMELVEGGNLDAWLAKKPPPAQVWAAVLGAGRGLAAAHAAGLVHRDFKPHNVLRSDDGRVMVTDFGLARGIADTAEPTEASARDKQPAETAVALDETLAPDAPATAETLAASEPATASGSPSARSKTDSVLDSPLTQTGAMIGTPAYMAPEQFTGGFAGARTDQFAFCVTAWQALTGARPFKGEAMGDLARAVLRGPHAVEADLPGAVRAVLERGLDPDPAKRWPSMVELLAALERASGQGRRRARLAFAALGAVGVIALAAYAVRAREPAPVAAPPPACPDAAAAIDEAWSPALRAQLAAHFTTPGGQRAAQTLDELRAAWIASYTRVCAAPNDALFHARAACLEGARDDFAAQTQLIAGLPADAFDRHDIGDVLPDISDCESEHPSAPPELPLDPAKRAAIHDVRAALNVARLAPPADGFAKATALESKLAAIGWRPLDAEVYLAAGALAQLAGKQSEARAELRRAARIAALTRHARVEISARIGLLEMSIERAANPRDQQEIPLAFEETEEAIANAGGSRSATAQVDLLHAEAFASKLVWTKAIERADRALTAFVELGDARRARRAAAFLASFYAARDREGDLVLARAAIARAEQMPVAPGAKPDTDLDEIGAEVAWRVRDLADVHRRLARARPRVAGTKLTWTGRVVDANGAPVAGAHVVAWSDELEGDAEQLDIAPVGTAEATTTGSGAFSLTADALAAVAAEQGDRRSRVLAVPKAPGEPLVLALGPTRTISGTATSAEGGLTGVSAEAVVTASNGATLAILAPVDRAGRFAIAHVPVGPVAVRLSGGAGEDAHRVVRATGGDVTGDGPVALVWPAVQPIDVIIRGATDDVDIYVIAGKVAPQNRAELFAAVGRAPTYAVAATTGIGVDTTAIGRALYTPDDVHAIVEGVAVPSTACAITRQDDALPECKPVEPRVEKLTERDGHVLASALAVVLEIGEQIGVTVISPDDR